MLDSIADPTDVLSVSRSLDTEAAIEQKQAR